MILDRKVLKNICLNCDFNSFMEQEGRVTLIGLRGARLSVGAYGEFSNELCFEPRIPKFQNFDCCIVIYKNGRFMAFPATTLPGVYWVENPRDIKGVASLMYGMHRFVIGKHRGHAALVQYGEFPVLRDTDQDMDMDFDSDYLDIGYFGINLHAGGHNRIGKWSAGCQVIQSEEEGYSWRSKNWSKFLKEISHASNKIFNYILIPTHWLQRLGSLPFHSYLNGGEIDLKTMRLLWRSAGNKVRCYQRQLNTLGFSTGIPDGKFGPATLRAVMRFQMDILGPEKVDGIIGPITGDKIERFANKLGEAQNG